MTTKPDPMAIQIGGQHYKGLVIQPTEFCMRNGLDACIHGALKYIVRWREKGGIEDLKKAIHYIQIRQKFVSVAAGWGARKIGMADFVHKNGVAASEADALYRLESYYNCIAESYLERAAERAIEAIEAIIRAEELKTA